MTMRMTIEDILRGTELGRVQSVGAMQILPLVGDDVAGVSTPDVEVRTSAYGTVHLRNTNDAPTLVPTGAGWVVKEAAQDHAIAGATIVNTNDERTVDTAMCVQNTQGGLIGKGAHNLLILPAALRAPALAKRKDVGYSKLWGDIEQLNRRSGAKGSGGHLATFIRHYGKQLDQFVAEFELVDDQVGAIIVINGEIVGIERAPTRAYWSRVWSPLVRICYGSAAVTSATEDVPATRRSLEVIEETLEGILEALESADRREQEAIVDLVVRAMRLSLTLSDPDDQYLSWSVHTVASKELSGQVMLDGDDVPYVSICGSNL